MEPSERRPSSSMSFSFASPKSSSFTPPAVSMTFVGFRIPMDHTFPVRGVECGGNLSGEAQGLVERKGTVLQALGEGFALRSSMTRNGTPSNSWPTS